MLDVRAPRTLAPAARAAAALPHLTALELSSTRGPSPKGHNGDIRTLRGGCRVLADELPGLRGLAKLTISADLPGVGALAHATAALPHLRFLDLLAAASSTIARWRTARLQSCCAPAHGPSYRWAWVVGWGPHPL